MSSKVAMICIDLQNDFSTEGGICYQRRPSVDFLTDELFTFLDRKGIAVAEIISDYRQPRPGDERDCCRPGEWGFESLVPDNIRQGAPWIKCMNSPIWTRSGIGDPMTPPGEPFQDPEGFGEWLEERIGRRQDAGCVVLMGLTADCCVLAAVQELKWRGYDVVVLSEGTDVRSGDRSEKERFLSTPPFTFWGRQVSFAWLKEMLGK